MYQKCLDRELDQFETITTKKRARTLDQIKFWEDRRRLGICAMTSVLIDKKRLFVVPTTTKS